MGGMQDQLVQGSRSQSNSVAAAGGEQGDALNPIGHRERPCVHSCTAEPNERVRYACFTSGPSSSLVTLWA